MRHWLVIPELMCRQHRLGEHLECHMFYSSITQIRSLDGYYQNGLFFGPRFLKYRHKELQKLIAGHQSPLNTEPVFTHLAHKLNYKDQYFYPDRIPTTEQITTSRTTLVTRCKICRRKHLKAKREKKPYRYTVDSIFVSRSIKHGIPG